MGKAVAGFVPEIVLADNMVLAGTGFSPYVSEMRGERL